MNYKTLICRFLIPRPIISFYYYLKFRSIISIRSEVDLSTYLKLGKNTTIGCFTKIKVTKGPLIIGENVTIGDGCHIGAGENGLIIGNDCIISPHVHIIGGNYRYDKLNVPIRKQGTISKGTVIGKNVWIGTGSCVLDGSKIGNGVIVAPNSVISSVIPDNVIVQGNPAKVIFTRR